MEKITTIGLDIAKHVFQVHGVDAAGAVAVRRKLRRDDVVGFFEVLPPCLIGIEACATKERLGRISKQGDPYIRRLLVVGAHAVLRFSRKGKAAPTRWAAELLAKKPYKVVAVALANKMARIAWALMITGKSFEASAAA